MTLTTQAAVAPQPVGGAGRHRTPRWSGAGAGRATPFRRDAPVTAARVKARARELGADLVGIASAQTLNAFPPDPLWPQTPERISPYVKSVITIVQHIPAGAFRCRPRSLVSRS